MSEPNRNHPTLDELITYHEGGLEEQAAERLREHVASCALCTAALLDLHAFAVAGGEAAVAGGEASTMGEPEARSSAPPADLEAAAFWRRLRPRLPSPSARRPWPRGWMALAAASLVVTAGLLLWPLRAPTGQVETLELGRLGGERAGETTHLLPTSAATVRLVGDVVGLAPGTRLSGWLEDPNGVRVWEGEAEVSAAQRVEIVVPAGRLGAGGYRLYLEGEGVAAIYGSFLLERP